MVSACTSGCSHITPEQEWGPSLTSSPRGSFGPPFPAGGTTSPLCHSWVPFQPPDMSPLWTFHFPSRRIELKPHLQLHLHSSPLLTPVLPSLGLHLAQSRQAEAGVSPAWTQLNWDRSSTCRALPKQLLLGEGQCHPSSCHTPSNPQSTDVSTSTTMLLRVLKANSAPLTASSQESNHHSDRVPKTQEIPRKFSVCQILCYAECLVKPQPLLL